ncbi:peptide-methionine (R)-S-oxide reductase MsrB [Yeosuana marina]|uniref:peptide-methionine (R)-S-oxide reductase MsrB n=1 Tax=Yeosuana marina TaxID=1565536 RepID=UPI0014215EDC|nr:peptide-methionine (R)-S-oxide reductase MsrB [Yeosuana marina]
MKKLIIITLIITCFSCNSNAQKTKKDSKTYSVTKTEAEWKAELSPMAFYVLRENGTEPRFSSPLNKNYKEGIYVCAGCNTPLFKSEHKYDSGSGWPSFDKEIKGNVAFSSGSEMYGREEHCAVCGGHLGHVFNDGPKETTGLRHCIDGAALKFIPKNE